jgi:probable rRNA maturation factor
MEKNIMRQIVQIEYLDIEKENDYDELIEKVIAQCFAEEKLLDTKIYISVTLTNPENIRKLNKEYRNIDKETDVLSFPMFEKTEIEDIIAKQDYEVEDVLGDIIISVERVKEQAKEYGHSFERELAYMLVHGFYHLMGYDHIEEKDKVVMRPKEEKILQDLNITRI